MSALQEIVNLLLSPPGDLYYHLALLFTLQILLAVAWGHWRRAGTGRMLWATGGLLLTRVLLIVASAAAGSGAVSAAAILPPLERFGDLLLILFAAWAFLPLLQEHPRLGAGLLGASLLASVLAYAYCAVTWPPFEAVGYHYNTAWQAPIWGIAGIALAALSLLALLIWPRPGLGLLAAATLTWLAGHLAQALLPSTAPHLAGFVRLSNLVAIPLIAALGFQKALQRGPLSSDGPAAAPEPLVALAQRVAQADDPETALAAALPEVARQLAVTVVALGVTAGETDATVRIVATHPAGRATAPTLPLKNHPLLSAAARTQQPQQSHAASDPGASALLHRLGLHATGPLRVEPLLSENQLVGLLLLADPANRPVFSPTQVEQAQALARTVATALARVQRWRLLEQERDQLAAALGEQEQKLNRRIAVLEDEIAQRGQEVREFAGRAAEMEQRVEQQRLRAHELAELLRIREEERETAVTTPAQLAIYQEELRQVVEERDRLNDELTRWKKQVQALSDQKMALEQRVLVAGEPAEGQGEPGKVGGVLAADARGNIVMADWGAQRLLARSQADLHGVPLHAAFADRLWTQTVSALMSEPDDGKGAAVTFQHNERLLRADLSRTVTEGEATGYIAVLRPEAPDEAPGEVITSITQEMRTPMTSIVGYTDLLMGESVGILGEGQRKFIQRIKANIERLSSLINDLIEITSLDTGRIELTPEPVDITTIVEEAIMGLSAQFRERDLTVRLDMALELPRIPADRDSLYQIMLHLLANACQCSRPGSEILVTSRLQEGREAGLMSDLLISVTDTGGGIAQENLPHVFQRFYRADNPLIHGLGDTGVGLAIAKALVEAHGGRIWVESVMDAGSTFSFILPFSRSTQPAETRDSGGP